MKHPERIIEVEWEKSAPSSTSYKVEIYIEAIDRLNLLRDVTVVLSDMGANVLSCNTISHRDGMVEICSRCRISRSSMRCSASCSGSRACSTPIACFPGKGGRRSNGRSSAGAVGACLA